MRLKFVGPLASLLKSQKQLRRMLSSLGIPPISTPLKSKRHPAVKAVAGRLRDVAEFGSNPGQLQMLEYLPPRLRSQAPLVVVLHGCLQDAQSFDDGSGWSVLARQHRFGLLYPEQRTANNPNRCFNWFRPSAVARDRGELMSIRQMIDHAVLTHGYDPARVYIVGLSAGGAMAAALLATYPELFAAGAIVGGLPFGAARDAMSALSVMSAGANRTPAEWGDLVRTVSPAMVHAPAISVWHGTDDRVVNIGNGEACVQQWLSVFGLDDSATSDMDAPWGRLQQWRDQAGHAAVSFYRIAGMGHGLPVGPKQLGDPGSADRFMLAAGISAPRELALAWGLKDRQ